MSAAATEGLKLEKVEAVLVLTLDRPAALNALTPELLGRLLKALRDAQKDKSVRVVILTGAGRAFCSGADLAALQGRQDPNYGDDLRKYFNPVIRQLRSMEKPVIAAVNGTAAGAGVALALACDLKVLAEEAKLHLAFIKVGLVPDSGMSWFLPRALGYSKALEHAWTGEPILAAAALQAGMVNKVVPAAQVLDQARLLAASLCLQAPAALGLTKRAMSLSLGQDLDAQLDYESGLQEVAGKGAEHKEGLAAFAEKRAPRFGGQA